MTPSIPLELHNARFARAEAWTRYGDALERDDPYPVLNQYGLAAEICDAACNRTYYAWQEIGGTSDIESIALHELISVNTSDKPLNRTAMYDKHPLYVQIYDNHTLLFTRADKERQYKATPARISRVKCAAILRMGAGGLMVSKDWANR